MKKRHTLTRNIEAWTGHAAARRESRHLGLLFCGLVLIIAAVLLLTGCMTASGNSITGEWKTAALGTDATRYRVNKDGIDVQGLNQTKGLGQALAAVEKMWKNYLVSAGLKFVAGKYYDHQNALVRQETTLKLENLRNARSVAEADAALATLKANHAAAAAAVPVPATPSPTIPGPGTGLN